ncbi:glucose 1-dehydrogenase [Ammoniphilus resinae]|uniref:NAD(P)-dependent dehydrogenase (Short-subunit alcohol dehydrogenase family) n=1 Tax=Ammoniphilus resinae TaxID=861532 RepID=A0ABS4GMZ0_9BACL|nr:glucose 1-dehydrogenase [Ammoniphilus resinae]MBP1931634.1 NAD(P)-dependent dehydrogenase (short-subunit alcohol dehydrogenase family) [Ammoniphilus resinae]
MKFTGKTVIVTGAASGIGKTIAAEYAKVGANVVLADIQEFQLEETVAEIKKYSPQTIGQVTDVRNPNDIISMMKRANEAFGRIDILINNAGVSRRKSPYDLTVEEWDDVIQINLRGSFLCAREVAKIMKQQKEGGAIVNIASTRAFMSEPNTEAYAASKGGIIALTHALAISLGEDRIRVNSISPGWIETRDYESLRNVDHEQHPVGRVGYPRDIAKACFFLTAEENDFITGENLTVDGGMTKKMIYEP